MKSFFCMLATGLAFCSLSYAQYGSSQDYSNYGQSSGSQNQYPQYGQGQQQQQQQPQVQGSGSDCDHLSQQEQQFASQLSVMHRTMFCRHFSVSQRIEAMTLASSQVQGLQGQQSSISPDEAVEIVMKNTRTNGAQDQQQQPSQDGSQYSYPSGSSSSNPYSNY